MDRHLNYFFHKYLFLFISESEIALVIFMPRVFQETSMSAGVEVGTGQVCLVALLDTVSGIW